MSRSSMGLFAAGKTAARNMIAWGRWERERTKYEATRSGDRPQHGVVGRRHETDMRTSLRITLGAAVAAVTITSCRRDVMEPATPIVPMVELAPLLMTMSAATCLPGTGQVHP